MRQHVYIHQACDEILISVDPSARRQQPKPLSADRWELLRKCEQAIYTHHHGGTMGHTDVNENDGDELVNLMWDLAYIGSEAALNPGPDERDHAEVEREVARRVACCLAVLNFGKEIMLV